MAEQKAAEKKASIDIKRVPFKALVEAGVHFGHNTARWNPKMHTYIWGARNKTHLIDVAKTSFLLKRACAFLAEATASGKPVLFVGTKKVASPLVQKIAEGLNMPYVVHRWIGGTLSNFEQVKKAVTRMLHLRDVIAKTLDKYSKKEQSMITKEHDRLVRNVGGIIDLTYPPAAIVVVDAKKEHSAIREASLMGIPVISMVDTNTDPSSVSYIIPSNDDSPRSIELILNTLSGAIEIGQKVAAEKAAAAAAAREAERKAKAEAREAEKKAKAEAAKAVTAAQKAAKAETKAAKTAENAEKKAAKPAAKKAAPKKPAVKADAKEEKEAKPAAKKPAAKKAPAKKAEKAEAKEAKPAAAKKPAAKKPAAKKEKAADAE